MGALVGCAVAGDPGLSGYLSASHPAVGRPDRHQSGGRRLQPEPSLDRQFPRRAGQPERRRGAVQYPDRLRRRNLDRVVIGLAFSWIVVRTNTPFKGFIAAASILPLFAPPLVAGVAWAILGSPKTGLIST